MRILIFTLLLSTYGIAQEPKPPTDAEIREAVVYDAIGEMAAHRDELLKKFAVVMHGEGVSIGMKNEPVARPAIFARVADKEQSFDLRAGYEVVDSRFEAGEEIAKVGMIYKSRQYPFIKDYEAKPPEKKLSKWLETHQGIGLDPFDDYLVGAYAFVGGKGYGQIEKQVLRDYKLLSTERILGGKLVSHWRYHPLEGFDLRIRMEFDPAYEMMLVRHSVENLVRKHNFQDSRISWEKHGKTLVPKRIEFAIGDVNDPKESIQYTFRCYWLIGDEVPDEVFTGPDHLAVLIDHFDITRSRLVNGKPVYEVHKLPEDLFKDAPKK